MRFVRAQIKIPRLMLKAKAAQAQPSLVVVFDSRDRVLFSASPLENTPLVFIVASSSFDDQAIVAITETIFYFK